MEHPLLDREKTLLKLNEELNDKCKQLVKTNNCTTNDSLTKLKNKISKSFSKQSIKTTNSYKNIKDTNSSRTKLEQQTRTNVSNEELLSNLNDEIKAKQSYSMKSSESLKVIAAGKVSSDKLNKLQAQSEFLNEEMVVILPPKDDNTKCQEKAAAVGVVYTSRFNKNSNVHWDTSVNKRNISSDGLIKFLKGKVTILQQELEIQQKEHSKKIEAFNTIIEEQKKQVGEKNKSVAKNNLLSEQVHKLEEKLSEAQIKLKEKDVLLQQQSKDLDSTKKELKTATHNNVTLEKRLVKAQDDLESLQKNAVAAKSSQTAISEAANRDRTCFEEQLKLLAKQRLTLINAYKKQLLLIDNLKRQNVCLEHTKLIEFAEKDFMKMLDWNNSK